MLRLRLQRPQVLMRSMLQSGKGRGGIAHERYALYFARYSGEASLGLPDKVWLSLNDYAEARPLLPSESVAGCVVTHVMSPPCEQLHFVRGGGNARVFKVRCRSV